MGSDTKAHGELGAAWSLLAAAIVLAVYVSTLSIMPKHVFWSPDEGGRYIEVQTVQWRGGIEYTLPYRGQRMDPERRFYPDGSVYPMQLHDGTMRLPWPIWFPLLSRMPLALFGITGIYLIPLTAGFLVVVVCGLLAWKVAPRLAAPTILLVGLASPIIFYSLTFWEHTLATLLALLGVAVTIYGGGSVRSLLVALPPVLLAYLLRLEMLAFVAVLPLAVLICNLLDPRHASGAEGAVAGWVQSVRLRPRRVQLVGAGLIIALLVLVWLAFPWHRRGFLQESLVVREGIWFLRRLPNALTEIFISTSRDEGPPLHKVLARLTLCGVAAAVLAAFVRRRRTESILLFSGLAVVLAFSATVAFMSEPYRALHGIVPVAPYVAVASYALVRAWRTRERPLLMLSLVAALYLLFGVGAILTFYVGRGGLLSTLEWGQRYVLTLFPLLAILAVIAFWEFWESPRPIAQRRAFASLFGVLVFVGLQIQARGLEMLYENRQILAHWDAALRVSAPVVTDLWWLPTAVPERFTTSEMFVLGDRAGLGEWVAVARRHGMQGFTFASDKPFPAGSWPQGIRWRNAKVLDGLYLIKFELPREPERP